MATASVGQVAIEIVADAKKFTDSLQSQMKAAASNPQMNGTAYADKIRANLDKIATSSRKLADNFKSVGTSLNNNITKPALTAAAAVGSVFAFKGWTRLVAIDTARGQFEGLGYDAQKVMEQVDKGVTNTSLSMAEGATMAVAMLATGSLPLEQVEEQIKRVANLSAAYGVEAAHAGRLLNNIYVKNKVTYGDLAQMQMNNIPVVTMLGEMYEKTGEEIIEMARNGQISIEDLNKALDENAGAAAEAYAGTWRGITANIMANVGKIGAKLMEPTFDIMKEEAAGLLEVLRDPAFAEWAENVGAKLGEGVGWVVEKVKGLVEWFQNLSPTAQKAIGIVSGILVAIGPVLLGLGSVFGMVSTTATRLAPLSGLMGKIASGVGSMFKPLKPIFTNMGGALAGFKGSIGGVGGALRMLAGPVGIAAVAIGGLMLAGGDAEVLSDKITGMVDTIVAAIPAMVDKIVTIIPQLIETIIGALPGLIDAGVEIVIALVEGIATSLPVLIMGAVALVDGLISAILESLPMLVEGALEMVMALVGGLIVALPLLIEGAIAIVVGLANAIVENLPALIDAGIEMLLSIIGGIVEAIPVIIETAQSLLTELIDAIVTALPLLIEAGVNLLVSLVEGLLEALPQLISAAITLVITLGQALLENIPLLLGAAIEIIVALASALITAIPELLKAIPEIFVAIWTALTEVDWAGLGLELIEALGESIESAAPGLLGFLGEVWGNIVGAFQGGWEQITGFFTEVWEGISAVFTWAWETVIKPVVDAIAWFVTNVLAPPFEMFFGVVSWVWEAISAATEILWAVIGAIFGAIVSVIRDKLGAAFNWLYDNIVKPVWDAIQSAIDAVGNWFQTVLWPIFETVINWFRDRFQQLQTNLTNVWNAIKAAINVVGNWFRDTLWPIFQNVINWFKERFDTLKGNVTNVWDGIRNAIGAVGNWFRDTLWPIFRNVLGFIGDGFDNLREAIKTAWDKITEIAKAPVRFIVYTVYRDGIKKTFDSLAEAVGITTRMPNPPVLGFASGGVLPGYTPGRDVHRFFSPTAGWLDLSGGEGIIRPDTLRSLGGKKWLERVNRLRGDAGDAYAGGGVWSPPKQSFAEGGVFGWVGDTFDAVGGFISNAVDLIGDVLSDPIGAVRNLILTPVKNLLEGIGGGIIGKIITGVPLKAVEWISSFFETEVPKSAEVTYGGYRGGPTLARLIPIIKKYGLVVTDTWGSPEYNASLGRVPTSYHGDYANPAVDIAGPFEAMEAAAAEIYAMGGWRQILWKVAGHWDHIHVANQGGVFGDLPTRLLYDSGGWLRPGSVAMNLSGRPEPVLTAHQWRLIERLVEQNAERGPGTIVEEGAVQVIGTLDPRRTAIEAVDRIVEKIGG